MNNYIARANVDHFLELLGKDGLSSDERHVVSQLLIDEEDKLSHDQEQLEFAESRTATCRDRLVHLQRLRDGFGAESTGRLQAERLLANFEATLQLMERFCGHMRNRVNGRAL